MPLAEQFEHLGGSRVTFPSVRRCRVCGCTDADCSSCIERTGMPCSWVEPDLCSAREERPEADVDLQAAAVEVATPAGAPALTALPWKVGADAIFDLAVEASDGLAVAYILDCPDAVDVARLLAAAPDLLAAAEAALELIARPPVHATGPVMRQLQAAVAKARG